MKTERQSEVFQLNQTLWKIFGLWPGENLKKYYKYYSMLFVTTLTIVYNVLLSVNLICIPRNVESFIEESIYFFTEIAVMAKIAMILFKRNKLLATFELLDCKEFQGSDDTGKKIVEDTISIFKKARTIDNIISHIAYLDLVLRPVITYFIDKTDLKLPIAQYYFLSDDVKREYFLHCLLYQSVAIYVHMFYNITVDTFIAGLIMLGIAQLKLLNHNFSQLKLDSGDDEASKTELNKLLRHYDLIVK